MLVLVKICFVYCWIDIPNEFYITTICNFWFLMAFFRFQDSLRISYIGTFKFKKNDFLINEINYINYSTSSGNNKKFNLIFLILHLKFHTTYKTNTSEQVINYYIGIYLGIYWKNLIHNIVWSALNTNKPNQASLNITKLPNLYIYMYNACYILKVLYT